jgi:hypothetical protein
MRHAQRRTRLADKADEVALLSCRTPAEGGITTRQPLFDFIELEDSSL